MKWLIVTAMVINGHLQFTETHDFDSKEECEAIVEKLISLYVKDGFNLRDMFLRCYRKGGSE